MHSPGHDLADALAAVQEAASKVREAQAGTAGEEPGVDLALRETSAHLEAARRVLFLAEVHLVGDEALPA